MAPTGRELPRTELLPWPTPGGSAGAVVQYAASVPALVGQLAPMLTHEAAAECAAASLELAILARAQRREGREGDAASLVLALVETIASCQVDGALTTSRQWAAARAGLPSTQAAAEAVHAFGALAAHRKAAAWALGLGAFAAAHRALVTGPDGARASRYRQSQTWMGGTDLWPVGASYVPPQPARIPVMMDDLVEWCARTDLDPVVQAAVAYAQILSMQPFESANGRVARSVIQGVFCRRGFSGAPVVPLSASLKSDPQRADAAWAAFREGDVERMVRLVARHTVRAAAEAAASRERVRTLPERWRVQARPRRGSAAQRLIDHLDSNPVVRVADVQRLTGASLASAYDAIVRLADSGVLQRLSRSRRDSVWIAPAVFDEIDQVIERLARPV